MTAPSGLPLPAPTTTAAGAVPAIVPLSLLEALRNLDTPVEDGLEELAGEIVSKRLGLSSTVAAQIQRYQYALRRGGRVPLDECVAVFRLVSRRPDAALVFADAGRRAARYAARQGSMPLRALMSATPGFVSRRVGGRAARQAARRVFGAELGVRGLAAEARMREPPSLLATPDGRACAYYGAAFAELLRCLTGFEGAMVHERCRGRGDHDCQWRAAAAEGYG
jgi:hypothetical protein